MVALFSILSITSMVVQNSIYNNVSKKTLNTNAKLHKYNMLAYLVCIVLFGLFMLGESISVYTVLLGLVFGVATALSNLYRMMALSSGPMHITLLVTTSSMIIPTMSGVFFGEKFSLAKLVLVLVLIGFIYMSMNGKGGEKINKKWFLCCLTAFIFQGSIGVLQKIHQSSPHKDEANAFLFVTFICSAVYCIIRSGKEFKQIKLERTTKLLALICGVCIYTMNFLNLKLSGMLPSQLFFPLINGSTIILCSVMSVVVFKERLSKKQLFGLVGGILTLIGICLVK